MKKLKRSTSFLMIVVLFVCQFTLNVCNDGVQYVYATEISEELSSEQSSKPSTNHQTQELDDLMNSDTEPKAPEKVIQSDNQVKEETGKYIVEQSPGWITDIVEAVMESKNDGLKVTEKALREAGEQKIKYASKVGYPKGARAARRGVNKLSKANELAEQISKYDKGLKIVDGISIGLDLYNIYKNTKDLGDLQNEHASMRLLEGGFLLADSGLAIASIGLTLMGTPVGWGFVAASLGVSALSAMFHSESFSNWMNSQDNAFLDALDWLAELLPFMKNPDGTGAYKPNIYIYSKSNQKITVKFKYPQLLTATIPNYEGIWNVLTANDGDLLFNANGIETTYRYLFYESITSKSLFQTEEGYYIPASERQAYFERILTNMGFTEEEIADFVEYWCEKLEDGVDYMMYPQETEIVDIAMPVEITPVPDSIERIWFAFEVYEGQTVVEPESILLQRSTEYAVVEWGGMIFE